MRSRVARLLPGLLVSVSFTVWFVWRAHWDEVGAALRLVDPRWVLLSAAVLFTEFLVRAARWKVLLRPIAPDARLGRLFVATVVGMSLNVLLPFRAGDLARPWLGARETGGSVLPLVTIAVIERVFDLCGLLGVFLLMVALLPGAAGGELVSSLELYGVIFGAGGLCGLGAFLWMAAHEESTRGLYVRLVGLLPSPMRPRFLGLFEGFATGLASVRDRGALATALGLSLVHWLNGTVSIWLLFRAFGLFLPFAAACFCSVAIALTVALPQAPGFFGVFHVAVEAALRLWGLDPAPAQAYAIVFWAVSFVPVATVGTLLSWREGFHPRMLTSPPPAPAPSPVEAPRAP